VPQGFVVGDRFASLDLGSNSFRLWIAELDAHGQLIPLANHKHPVRLASGVGQDGQLAEHVKLRALGVVESFAQIIREQNVRASRAVATSTFRVAVNAGDLIARSQDILGHPVEIVSGLEEARLIYKGAARRLPSDGLDRLVIDIGGGSTECIIGQDDRAKLVDSAAVGCVFLSKQFFPEGRVTRDAMDAAVFRAEDHFAPMVLPYKRMGWKKAFGTSGTAKSLTQVAQTHFGRAELTLPVLREMTALLLDAGHVDHLHVDGLKPERRPVLAGGLAVMIAAFEEFGIESLQYCQGALRQGALYDLIERRQGLNVQSTSVRLLMQRYAVDMAHAERMAATARALFSRIAEVVPAQFVGPDMEGALTTLTHATHLAEIGLAIAHEEFNRHSHYILSQADIPGFSKPEQGQLARLTLAQYGSIQPFRALSPEPADWTLLLCLRWASILNRQRQSAVTVLPKMKWQDGQLMTVWPKAWQEKHRLTWATLQHEKTYWSGENFQPSFSLG
jgi:exopolyphosphatase / guanosine-5'-triphosphate,3'-diphosphate pyrophosphatase